MISTGEGGLFEVSKNDDVLAAPGLAKAVANGGSTTVNAANTRNLEDKQDKTNLKLERVAKVLEEALSGAKPSLARSMGRQVGDTILEA